MDSPALLAIRTPVAAAGNRTTKANQLPSELAWGSTGPWRPAMPGHVGDVVVGVDNLVDA